MTPAERKIDMGEKTEQGTLYMKTPDGEYVPLLGGISEVTLAESEEIPMSCMIGCRFCQHSDENRRKEDKIRCKRWSQWVKPIGEVCEEYTEGFTMTLSQKGAEEHE